MAKEMTDEKPKSRASSLYDNERSQKKPTAKADEKKPEAKDEKPEPKAEPEGEGADSANGADKLIEGMKTLAKQHEAERRDAHGNQREALRQMAGRHQKQMQDLMESHIGQMGGENDASAPAEESPDGQAA